MGGFSVGCNICNAYFLSWQPMRQHMKDKHNIGPHKGGLRREAWQVSSWVADQWVDK